MTQENTQTNHELETVIDEEITSTDESLTTEEENVDSSKAKHIPYDRFKAKVDEANALKEKLAEIEKAQEEAQRKELEDKQEYKELYEKAVQDAAAAKQEALGIKKSALLTQAGYSEEQAQLLVKLVEGDDDEAIAESIKLLKTTVPSQDNYADPSAFNGEKEKPVVTDNEEVGRNAVSRVLHKIKL